MHDQRREAIRKAVEQEFVTAWVPDAIAKQVLTLFSNQHKSKENEFDLTKREQEILTLLVQGYSYNKISEKCFISYSTVNSHISHIYEKLHVNNKTEAINLVYGKK